MNPSEANEPAYRWAEATLLPDRRLLLVEGRDTRIGARAFDLLLTLVERRERVVPKNELFERVWPGVVVEDNNLAVHVGALRRLLGAGVIATVPGRGYRFTAALAHAPRSAAPPPPSTPAATVPAPALFGRDDDIAVVHRLLQAHRLVSVVGPGGIGKTSLIGPLVALARPAHADGVVRVDLAPVAQPAWVLAVVAAALDLRLVALANPRALGVALQSRRLLLVLDNCEHVLAACAEIAAAVLDEALGVSVLATSQEPLKLAQEQVYRLPPLGLPVEGGLQGARASGAVALFEARARAVDPRFALDADNADAIADICRRLDGIALAIELAAARVALLGVVGVRARLDERFQLLTGGTRLALPRQRTLRAAFDWSHDLLTDDERAVLRRLASFVGSFGLQGAQAVAGDTRIDAWAVLDHLGALVDKSMVVVEAGEPPRYRLLETTRLFALEQLRESGEELATRARHAQATLALFEGIRADEFTVDPATRLRRALPDLDNARAALDHAQANGQPTLHVALAGAIGRLWLDAGLRPEGLERQRMAIAAITADTPPALEARLLASWSWIASPTIGPEELRTETRAVALWREVGDTRALFVSLCRLATMLAYGVDRAPAAARLAEAAALQDPGWPFELRASLLHSRAWLQQSEGRFDDAIATYAEVRDTALAAGLPRLAMTARINTEQTLSSVGRLDEAIAHGRAMLEALAGEPELYASCATFVHCNLAMALTLAGRVDEALIAARAALPVVRRAGRLVDMIEPGALLALQRGRLEDAARITGRAHAGFAATHTQRDMVERRLVERLHAQLRERLPAAALARLFEEGAALDDEQALRLAFQD